MTDRPGITAALAALEEAARTTSAAEAPALVGELERVKAIAWARLAVPASSVEDRLLSIEEAMARTGMSRTWLYRHAAGGGLPWAHKVGRRLLFSSAGLTRWLATRGGP